MSLRDPSHQAAIELGEMDTEYVTMLKDEREKLLDERRRLKRRRWYGKGFRLAFINRRLTRIRELLAK